LCMAVCVVCAKSSLVFFRIYGTEEFVWT
jgi:hypothetical protein